MDETTLRPGLLLVRPEAQSRRFLFELTEALGADVDAVISPLFDIVAADPPPEPRAGESLVMTSPHAAISDLKAYAGRPAHVVGKRTRVAADQAGLGAGETADTVAELAERLASGAGPLLYLRGEHVSGDLLAAVPGQRIREAIVYRQPEQGLTRQAIDLCAGDRTVLLPLFSARSAALAGAALAGAFASIEAFAISPSVAEAWPGTSVRVVRKPDGDAMISALLERLGAAGGC